MESQNGKLVYFALAVVCVTALSAKAIPISSQGTPQTPLQFLNNEGQLHIFNSKQYTVTMSATHTDVRTLVVGAYGTRSGSTCTGSSVAAATMSAPADETLSSGVTYAATNASSWSMVNNNGGASTWNTDTACVRYTFKNVGGSTLHTKDCAVWYSSSGASNCTSLSCGQNASCTDSW